MPRQTSYEWEITEHDEYGDIVENHFADKLSEYDQQDLKRALDESDDSMQLGLMRDNIRDDGDDLDRSWAYVESGELPEEFDAGWSIPKRFRNELKKVRNQ